MIDYAAARAVAMVVQTGSFEAAAAALHVTPSAVSQRVRKLEEQLGLSLVVRGHPCTATERGAWLCRHMEHVALLEQQLRDHLPALAAAPAERVTLHVATNADSLGTWFLPALAPFMAETDHLIDIALDDEEHTAEWLRRGQVIAAVTTLEKPVPGCRVTRLGRLCYCATASPAFMRRYFPAGVSLQALARAPALTFNQKDRLQQLWMQQTFGQAVAFPRHWLPSTQGFVDASLAGLGWGLNPLALVRDHLDAGRLVELVPDTRLERALFWQISHLVSGPLAPLTAALTRAARAALLS
ncbi:MAG: LysR family transcriptional regulator ArgP [Pararhodobacter sp.]|nr:LysR family transcriptional regulator ArgP [Pararhodobacter sp.]